MTAQQKNPSDYYHSDLETSNTHIKFANKLSKSHVMQKLIHLIKEQADNPVAYNILLTLRTHGGVRPRTITNPIKKWLQPSTALM